MIIIHKASVTDATLLTNLARKIYREYYLHLWLPGGAEWYIEQYAYAPDKIEKELADTGIELYIAFEDDSPVGYIKLVLNATFADDEKLNALEVERIYLHTLAKGKGLGKQLMTLALQRATELQKEIIFLKAMDSARDAIAFYKSLGYSICGSLQLPLPEFELMKKEYRGMIVLKRKVAV